MPPRGNRRNNNNQQGNRQQGRKPQYEEGIHYGVITGQRFAESKNGTPLFGIRFRPTHKASAVDVDDKSKATPVTGSEREITIYITEGTIKAGVFMRQLRSLGWKENSFATLDPTVPGFTDFSGIEAKFLCRHESGKSPGKIYDNWDLYTPGGTKKEHVEGVASKLDALFSNDMMAFPVDPNTPPPTRVSQEQEDEQEYSSEEEDSFNDTFGDDGDEENYDGDYSSYDADDIPF